jgi:hypothetical protein
MEHRQILAELTHRQPNEPHFSEQQTLEGTCAPNDSQDEPPASPAPGSLIHFLESIAYPQRFGLERLLTSFP